MLKIIIVLLTPLLISSKCTRTDVRVTCAQIASARVDNLPLCDLSFEKNRCRCRCFNLTDYQIVDEKKCKWPDGSNFQAKDYDIYTCEGIGGFFVEEWASEVKPKLKKLRNLYGNLCGR